MDITIVLPLENLLKPDINAEQRNRSWQLDTGPVKIYGLAKVVAQNLAQRKDKENISIFVK